MCNYLSQDNIHFPSFKAGALTNYPDISDSLIFGFKIIVTHFHLLGGWAAEPFISQRLSLIMPLYIFSFLDLV